MSDLISRSALKEIRVKYLTRQVPEWYSLTDEEKKRLIRITKIHQEIVSNAPAVDAVPVVHGRWEKYFDGKYIMCSACKASFWSENGETSNYCPNCGAKMDGGEDNATD